MKTKLFIATLLVSSLMANNALAVTVMKYPLANASLQQWGYTGASPAYAAIDDNPSCDGNSSYIHSNTIGNTSSFYIQTTSGTINTITIYPCVGSSSPYASAKMKFYYSIKGVNSALSSEYTGIGTPTEKSGFTWTNINDHVGETPLYPPVSDLKVYAVMTGGTVEARVSRVRVEITYAD